MNRTKLAEYMERGDLWGSVKALSPFPFFDEYSPENLNRQTKLLFGERNLYSKFSDISIEDAAEIIVISCQKKWLNLMLIDELDFNLAASESERVNQNTAKEENRDKNIEQINKVSAYNSEDMVNEGGSNVAEDELLTGEETRITTRDKISLDSAYNNLSMADKISIIKTVVADVAEVLTLSIY